MDGEGQWPQKQELEGFASLQKIAVVAQGICEDVPSAGR